MALEKKTAFLTAFGQRVTELRTAKRYSLRSTAEKLHIDKHQLSRIERGEIATSIMMAYRLAEVFGISLPKLFTFEIDE